MILILIYILHTARPRKSTSLFSVWLRPTLLNAIQAILYRIPIVEPHPHS